IGKRPILVSALCVTASKCAEGFLSGATNFESVRAWRLLGRYVGVVVGRRFHRSSGSAFGDRDQRGSQDALTDHVAGLYHLRYGSCGARRIGSLVHGLMDVWIEFVIQRLEFFYSVLLQHLQELALSELDAVE